MFDLSKEWGIRPHFKAGYTGQGRVIVANNTYQDSDYEGKTADGRLAEWDGNEWTILETCMFNTVTGRTSISSAIYAVGADNASAILKVRLDGQWQAYRLPKATHTQDHNRFVGQPQANLWFGKTDDLWSFGKPKGWGGPWRGQLVEADQPSDPFLMTGFEHKCLHLTHGADRPVSFQIQVDFRGDGSSWETYETIDVPANGYTYHVFPTGFSAHWVRIVSSAACKASAIFHYT